MLIPRHVFQTQHNGGKWRVARVRHCCDWSERVSGIRCLNWTDAGERYFDTKLPKRGTQHVTLRICSACANQTIEV